MRRKVKNKMKKISVISLMLVLAMCVAVFSGCAKKEETEAPDGMKLASGEKVDYYMYVPETWKVDNSELYTAAYFSSGDATSISATAYGISAEITTVDAWWTLFEEEMAGVYSNISEIAKADAKIDGIDGKEFTFSATLGDQEYNFIITAVIKDYYVYYITYTSIPEYNEDHLEERTQVIDAFRFKD